jgi:uncharacterized protein (TIGR01777 family)
MAESKKILIAGGTGFIGKVLVQELQNAGHEVRVLSRSAKTSGSYYWNPRTKEIDVTVFEGIQILINLSGSGIADQRWTEDRKKDLYASRIGTNEFLFHHVAQMPELEQFITASGINAYGFDDMDVQHSEDDPFGTDFLSQLVQDWEKSADVFSAKCQVAKIRIAVVLGPEGGALKRMLPAIKMGIGSPLGAGKQFMPWIHAADLVGILVHTIDQKLNGAYNAVAQCDTNREFMKALAQELKKPFFFPAVPSFVLRALFGEMANVLLKGTSASNKKIQSVGYSFKFPSLEKALADVFKK